MHLLVSYLYSISLSSNHFLDVGAYLFGKRFGKVKLSRISSVAGMASPNKSVIGTISGLAFSVITSLVGAYKMKWPLWYVSGALYGLLLGILGFVGDITESLLKRDAGVKDSGNAYPGHGGVLDRFDSYILTAPIAYYYIRFVLPLFSKVI